jgi:hypothetical protein
MSDLNDINIYVEDTGKEYEYEEILERLFGDTLKIFCIYPLGGKDAVLNCHEEKDLYDPDGKLNVFIVDGDFDNLWDDTKVESPNLIYLTRYNIESFLISKEATTKYMRVYLQCTRREAESRVNFDGWKEEQKRDAGKLFILFAVAQHFYPDLPSVNGAAGTFMDDKGHLLEDQYEKYRHDLAGVVPALDEAIEDVKNRINNKFDGDDDQKIFSIICGKYLYESLCRHLKTVKNKNIHRISYKSTVISNFDISTLTFVRERIDQLRMQESA